MAREELSDRRWEQLRPLLPPQKPRTGRPNNDHRTVLSGMLWILRTGAPWRDLPPRFGAWATVASRFYRWRKAGIWQRLLERLQQQSDQAGVLDWSLHFVDGTVVRAHQHAAGAKRSTPQEEALGRRGIRAVIPTKKDERPNVRFDRAAYRERNVVERLINRLKAFRRVATRYEKRAANYLAMCTLAAIMIWL